MAALIAGGFGAVAYVLAWLLVRSDDRDDAIIRAVRADRRGLMLATAAGTALAAIQVAGSLSGIGWLGFAAWPLGLTALGILLVWRNAPPDEQAVLRRLARQLLGLTGERSRSRVLVRATLGAVLAAAGLLTLAAPRQSTALLRPLGGTALWL